MERIGVLVAIFNRNLSSNLQLPKRGRGFIYVLKNTRNGKIYVGQTRNNPTIRINDHCKSDSLIGSAIREYGLQSFSSEIFSFPLEDLNIQERKMIADLDSRYPKGYNVSIGGEGWGLKHMRHTPVHYIRKTMIENIKFAIKINNPESLRKFLMLDYIIESGIATVGVVRMNEELVRKGFRFA
jgi:hypothetical protein